MRLKTVAAVGALALGATSMAGTASAESHVVKMKFDDDSGEVYFEPAKVTVQPGDTVVWIQADADNEHNVAAYPDRIPHGAAPFESPMLEDLGESWARTFDVPGSYFYHCHPHEAAGMRGLVVVGRESLPEEFRRPAPGEMSHDHGEGHGHDDGMGGHHDGEAMKDMDDHDGGGHGHHDDDDGHGSGNHHHGG